MPKKSSSSVRVFYPKFDTKWVVKTLKEHLPELQRLLPVKQVVLFGSYAKGNYTVASDVDVLVIYEGQAREDAYNLVWDAFPIPRLEPHVYSEEEYHQLKSTIDRMKAGGIVIFGDVKADYGC